MSDQPLPWHAEQWRRVRGLLASGRMPHALLLAGAPGLGKALFAEQLARTLVCARPTEAGRPCEACHACALSAAATHPDMQRVEPAEGARWIGIDQIRALVSELSLTAQLARYKTALVLADAMTVPAANSLLKTLEEPPGDCVLMLVSHRIATLPVTIRSRCVLVKFDPVPGERAEPWLRERLGPEVDARLALALAAGAPLRATRLVEEGGLEQREQVRAGLCRLMAGDADPVSIAAAWSDIGAERAAAWMISLLAEIARARSGLPVADPVSRDAFSAMQAAMEGLDLRAIFDLLDKCAAVRRARATHAGLNEQLLLEELALGCSGPRGRT